MKFTSFHEINRKGHRRHQDNRHSGSTDCQCYAWKQTTSVMCPASENKPERYQICIALILMTPAILCAAFSLLSTLSANHMTASAARVIIEALNQASPLIGTTRNTYTRTRLRSKGVWDISPSKLPSGIPPPSGYHQT